MRITWVNPVFLDYRVPVYKALDNLAERGLTLIFSKRRTPPSVCDKIASALGARAVGLAGEKLLTSGNGNADFTNAGYTVPYQKGLYRAIAASRPEVLIGEGFFQWTPVALLYKVLHRVPLVIAYERTAHTERNAAKIRVVYRRLVARMTDAIACNGRLSKEFCRDGLGIATERIVSGAYGRRHPRHGSSHSLGRRAVPALIDCGPQTGIPGLLIRRSISSAERRARAPRCLDYVQPRGGGKRYSCAGRRRAGARLPGVNRPRARASECRSCRSDPLRCNRQVLRRRRRVRDADLEDNWSLVVPEAMSCGLPILCTRYNGCWPELVRENENGWVFRSFESRRVCAIASRLLAPKRASSANGPGILQHRPSVQSGERRKGRAGCMQNCHRGDYYRCLRQWECNAFALAKSLERANEAERPAC